MKLPPVLRYFGSKWRSAPRYPEPKHDVIVEPFAGGAGYSLHYPERQVILIEANPVVAGIWKWLIQADPNEIAELPLVKPGESIANYEIRKEAKDFIGFWNTISGAAPQYRMVPSAERIPASFWNERIRERTAKLVEHIRHWKIVNGDMFKFRWNGKATWFVDPTYQHGYRYPGSSAIDYGRLAEWCKTRKGQVIVCENELADWLDFKPLADLHAAPRAQFGGAAARRSKECIWVKDG